MTDNKLDELPNEVKALLMAIAKGHAYVLAIEGDFGSEVLFCNGGHYRRHQGDAAALRMLEKFARKERKARASPTQNSSDQYFKR